MELLMNNAAYESGSGSNSSSSSENEEEEILSEAELLQFCQNTIFVDMRGFRSNFGRFICKEFCLVDSDGSIFHKFNKPQFPVKRLKYIHQIKVEYEEKFGHRIPYDYGNMNIVELITDTYEKFDSKKKILVRDKNDERNLKHIFRNYCQINSFSLSDLNFDDKILSKKLDLLPYCDYHNKIYGWGSGPCAKKNALKLRYIFVESEKKNKSENVK